MIKRLAIHGLCLFLLATGVLGCAAPTRYHVLCFLFDGVPAPPGMVPCDGARGLAPGQAASAGAENEAQSGYVQHGPYAAKLCEGCHQRQTNKLIRPVEELCLNCHDINTAKKKLHGPLASGGCTVCHNPHGSGNPFLLVADSRVFCMYCHKQEDLQKNEVHRDTDEACTMCHNAHASDNDYLLRDIPGQVFTRRKQAPKLTTEIPKPEVQKNTRAQAPENGKKAQKTQGVKSTQAEAPRNSRRIPRPEEVKNIKPQAPELTTKTPRPEEAKNTEAQTPKNGKKAKIPEEVKNIKYQAPVPDYDREDSKTKKDKTAQLSSAK